jgi:hypothetical protein
MDFQRLIGYDIVANLTLLYGREYIRENKLVMSTKREFGVYIYFVGNKRKRKESMLFRPIYGVYVSLALPSKFSNSNFSNLNFSNSNFLNM